MDRRRELVFESPGAHHGRLRTHCLRWGRDGNGRQPARRESLHPEVPDRLHLKICDHGRSMGTRRSWLFAAVLFPAFANAAAIDFPDFISLTGLTLAGSARQEGRVLRLTPSLHDVAGAAWFREKQLVGGGFESVFQFRLTEQGGLGRGADGF